MRRVRVAALVAAAVLALTGCGQLDEEQRSANEAEVAQLERELAARPGVAEISVTYVFDASTAGVVAVDADVAPDADHTALVERAVEAAWRSRITPLGSVNLVVRTTGPDARQVVQDVVTFVENEELTERYGPRSVPDG